MKALDLRSVRHGRLVGIERAGKDKSGKARWQFICDCGSSFEANGSSVVSGATKSCGCLRNEICVKRIMDGICKNKGTHGATREKHPEYYVWKTMKARCNNTSSVDYPAYGGRGISVCDRWLNNYQHFIDDMGRRPSGKTSIERENNNGNYEPGNCHWADDIEQANNRRARGTGYRAQLKEIHRGI